MPRQERRQSATGIYHVMLRGINKQDIFEDDEDIDAYREQRKQIDKNTIGDDASGDSLINRFLQIQATIEEAKAKLELE